MMVLDVEGDPNRSTASASALKTALILKTSIFDLTFPQIVVRGTYIGGSDDVIVLIQSGRFQSLLLDGDVAVDDKSKRSPRHTGGSLRSVSGRPLTWEDSLLARSRRPDLLTVPAMYDTWYPKTPFYSFQFVMYANLLRYISIFQICYMIGIGALFKVGSTKAGLTLTYIFLYDLMAFVVFGNTPFCITGTICQYLFWRIRGNTTSILPYKVIFIVYFAALLRLVLQKEDAEVLNADAQVTLVGLISNSALLAAFRF